MNHLTEYQIVLSPLQLISDRIEELKKIIEKYGMIIETTTSLSSKRVYERKREWILGILQVNEQLYEQYREASCNGLH